ncbi:MAG: hypothetical protein LKJ94_05815 [Candidatus Methanomethylophilus sp.]|nr:hypothetical protein [Methanomethylophilus sp.]
MSPAETGGLLSSPMAMFVFGCGVMAAAIFFGRAMRGAVHAILPIRDPFWVFSVIGEALSVAVLEIYSIAVPDAVLVGLLCFNGGYLLGYCTAKASDVVYLDLPNDDLTETSIGPFVHYTHGGASYCMPQTFAAVLLSHMGARHPLDMPLGSVVRVRSVKAASGVFSLGEMKVFPVAVHETEQLEVGIVRLRARRIRDPASGTETFVPRYLFRVSVTSHVIRFAQELTDDPEAFWTKSGVYRAAVVRASEAVERATRLDIQMQSSAFDSGARVVAGLISLQEDAPGTRDDILRAVAEERTRRAAAEAEGPQEAEYAEDS